MTNEQVWQQPITKVAPNEIAVRGYRIESLMGQVPFAHVVYLTLKGELPTPAQGRIMDAILVSSVDHGATPPSVLAARTVASGGAPLTTGIAAGIMTINRHHGGAIEGCMDLLRQAVTLQRERGITPQQAAQQVVAEARRERRRLPGYGHRLHSGDPRAKRLFELTREEGLAGEYVQMAEEIQNALHASLGKSLPLNVDGAIAAVLCELDFPTEMGNGLFAISRIVGLTAHVFDEITRQRPMRRISPTAQEYNGPAEREVPQ